MSKKKNESAAGILFNTFGTILLLTMIAICAINFVRDGRGYHMLAEKASANANNAADNKKGSSEGSSGSSKNDVASKTDSKKNSDSTSKPATGQKSADKSANKQSGTNSKNADSAPKKPVVPGEEP